jgi:hypothetical protein
LTRARRAALPPLSVHILGHGDFVVGLQREVAGVVGVIGVESCGVREGRVICLRRRSVVSWWSRGWGGSGLVVAGGVLFVGGTVAVLLAIAVILLVVVVLAHGHVVQGGGWRRLQSAGLGGRCGDCADGDRGMEGGLLGKSLEEVGEGLGSDNGDVSEVFQFLRGMLSLKVAWVVGGGMHTALMVRMERFTMAVCISSRGAMLLGSVMSDYTGSRKGGKYVK